MSARRQRRPELARLERDRLRERAGLDRRDVAPRRRAVEDQVRQQLPRDVVEHQRRDDLVRPRERLQRAGDQRPERAAGRSAHAHRDDRRRRADSRPEPDRDAERTERAEVELALGADVEQVHPERRRRCEAREEERRRRRQRRRPRRAADEGGVEQPPVGVDRVVPGGEQHDRHHQERERDRAQRDDDVEPARLVEPALDLDHARSPPAIASPISSTVAVDGSNGPVISPS